MPRVTAVRTRPAGVARRLDVCGAPDRSKGSHSLCGRPRAFLHTPLRAASLHRRRRGAARSTHPEPRCEPRSRGLRECRGARGWQLWQVALLRARGCRGPSSQCLCPAATQLLPQALARVPRIRTAPAQDAPIWDSVRAPLHYDFRPGLDIVLRHMETPVWRLLASSLRGGSF